MRRGVSYELFKMAKRDFFVATITYTLFPLDKKTSPIDGYFKRSEVIITKGEDRIELNTNADFLAKEMKYTSIITITDVDKENQYSTFSIDGEMYLKNGLIVSKTNQVEDTDHINKKLSSQHPRLLLSARFKSHFWVLISTNRVGINIY